MLVVVHAVVTIVREKEYRVRRVWDVFHVLLGRSRYGFVNHYYAMRPGNYQIR